MGIKKDRSWRRRKYKNFNEDYFDIINTEAKAYFLGLLFADGNVSTNRNTIRIQLSEYDKHILSIFSSEIYGIENIRFINNKKYSYRCANANNSFYLEINSKYMKNKLIKHGCVPNKSLKLEFPNNINDTLLHHFIRGYFDGDGCLTYSINKFNRRDYSLSFTTTYNFCNSIKDILYNKLNTNTYIYPANVKNNITKTLQTGGNRKILKILNWLYDDSFIFLERKYNKYIELKQLCFEIDARKIVKPNTINLA